MTTPSPTPTASGQDGAGLTALVKAHRLAGLNGYCRCGWATDPHGGDKIGQHDAHLAAVLTARLSEPDVVEAAAALERVRALADEWERLDRLDFARNQYAMAATRRSFVTDLRAALDGDT